MVAIEKKIQENKFGLEMHGEREKVPKWNRDTYDDKVSNVVLNFLVSGIIQKKNFNYNNVFFFYIYITI